MNDEIREAARSRIKARRGFWNMLLVFLVITVILNVIWFVSEPGAYYWPMWPMIGFGIATLFSAINVFGAGSRPITETDIDREVRKLGGDGPK